MWNSGTYHRARARLIEEMGGKCVLCGSVNKLEFDHPKGRDWEPSRVNRMTRLRYYKKDLAAGNLRLLCKKCNLTHLPESPEHYHEECVPK